MTTTGECIWNERTHEDQAPRKGKLMSNLADEARAEARKRWPEDQWASAASGTGPEQLKAARRVGFIDGTEWQASRKPEAAPSDTRDEVLVEGSYFAVADLPKILGNYMRSSAKHAREAKAHWLKVAELKQMLVELKPAPSDTDREALAELLFSIYDHGTNPNALREADAILAAGFSRTSQPVQVEVTEHKITQRMPWPPSPESSYMLSLFECSCGWKTNAFKDTRDNRATIEDYRQYAESHAAALGGGKK